ncbi:MAG: hypothetical protein WDO16_13920 [Bacteroidota bacterium]
MNDYSASLDPQYLAGKAAGQQQSVLPVASSDRIKTVDVVRGFALSVSC